METRVCYRSSQIPNIAGNSYNFVSFLLIDTAEAPDRPLTAFSYQSEKPVFDLGPYKIFGAPQGDDVTMWATDYQDDLAVTATPTLN
jgi:hypothetical protein